MCQLVTLQIARRLAGIVCFLSCCGVSGGNMSDFIPKVLIFGHSFVRRLHDDLVKGFDSRAKQNFNLAGSGAYVCLKGTGGRTVEKVRKYDISAIASIQPDIIILELGTNDLCHLSPEVVGSCIEEHCTAPDAALNAKAAILRQYLCVVLENEAEYFSGNTVTLVVM